MSEGSGDEDGKITKPRRFDRRELMGRAGNTIAALATIPGKGTDTVATHVLAGLGGVAVGGAGGIAAGSHNLRSLEKERYEFTIDRIREALLGLLYVRQIEMEPDAAMPGNDDFFTRANKKYLIASTLARNATEYVKSLGRLWPGDDNRLYEVQVFVSVMRNAVEASAASFILMMVENYPAYFMGTVQGWKIIGDNYQRVSFSFDLIEAIKTSYPDSEDKADMPQDTLLNKLVDMRTKGIDAGTPPSSTERSL